MKVKGIRELVTLDRIRGADRIVTGVLPLRDSEDRRP
jgi:hypothetical protein